MITRTIKIKVNTKKNDVLKEHDLSDLFFQVMLFSTLLGIHTLTSLIKSYKKAHSKQSINVEN